MKLAENIRAHRKARGLTQEQLAEVLGVTVGAVYKWEAKLSTPELPLIVEMADFFDCSVDALLGYEMKDNRLDATEARIWRYHSEKNREGLAEVEKALKRYPNAFRLPHTDLRWRICVRRRDFQRATEILAAEGLINGATRSDRADEGDADPTQASPAAASRRIRPDRGRSGCRCSASEASAARPANIP
jgi:transcriptional regulator with XRE-family HTH domain